MYAPMGITGYGISGQYLFRELLKLDYDITLWPKGGIQGVFDSGDTIGKAVSQKDSGFDPHAPCFHIWHQYDLMSRLGKGPYVAYSFFELEPLNKREQLHMSIPDVMCVASKWAANIVKRDCGIDAKVLPCGIDPQVFYPYQKDVFNKRTNSDTYVFFNIGKWEKRKGHDIICRAFDKAFEQEDNVQLVMMPNNIFLKATQLLEWHNKYKNAKLANKIHFLHSIVPYHTDVADIINSFDCGVFPARSEGWNLELLESMACGKPVITTNVSAHTEYCTKDNAFLIEAPNQEEAYDGTFFFGGGNWAELDYEEEEQLVEHFRYCYKNRPSNPNGITTAQNFTWENSAKILREILLTA